MGNLDRFEIESMLKTLQAPHEHDEGHIRTVGDYVSEQEHAAMAHTKDTQKRGQEDPEPDIPQMGEPHWTLHVGEGKPGLAAAVCEFLVEASSVARQTRVNTLR